MGIIKQSVLFNNVLSCALITHVKNAPEIRENIILSNLKCVVIKPCLIIDIFQIGVATNKALLAESRGRLATKSVYTEILFNLSINKSISQSLLQFGINDSDTEMIVLSVCSDAEMNQILSYFKGEIVDMSELSFWTDKTKLKKAYKINDLESSVSNLLDTIVSKISTKDFVNH